MQETDNLPEVLAAVEAYKLKFLKAVEKTAQQAAISLAGMAQNEIKGDRSMVGYPATPNEPPMNVTGNLRRSIRGSSARIGFGEYEAVAGAYMEYARAVELGSSRWRNGQKFPYMQPALDKFRTMHAVEKLLAKNFRRVK